MCGICGFIGPYNNQDLELITNKIKHRGPDDSGYFFSQTSFGKNIGLGHRRLSIIDLGTGHQPIWNEKKTKCIIFNGEIYNYQFLRKKLVNLGHSFSTKSDTEVILHGYESYGSDFVQQLEGMFAFAIWDTESEQLFIARDRLGIKPIYYYSDANSIIFASEIKSILPLVNRRMINKSALYHYLLFGFASQEHTIFENIMCLPPAHYLIWESQKFRTNRYWDTPETIMNRVSETDWTERIREALYDSVKSHMISDVPVGITLSGGLDSSAILAMMSRATDQHRINSFTVGYNLPDDEIHYSRIAAGNFKIYSHESLINLSDVADQFPRIIYHLEEPIAHPVLGTTYFLAKKVSEELKVVLIGEGSDELFAGYPHYQLFDFPFSLTPNSFKHYFFFKGAYLMPSVKKLIDLLQPDWLDRSLLEEIAHMYDTYFQGERIAEKALRFELKTELVGNQLNRIDKLMMSHSVEARVPFLDRSFVEMALSIPFQLKMKNGLEKYILRKAVEPLLPSEVVYRPKSGKGGTQALLTPLLNILLSRYSHYLHPSAIDDSGIFKGKLLKEEFFNPPSFWQGIDPFQSRSKNKFTLAILILEIWKRIFIEGENLDQYQ